MLSSISWQQFLVFLLISNAIYYLFIWVFFFKARIPSFSGIGNMRQLSQGEDQPDEMLTSAQFIMDELRPLFPGRTNKNEILLALQSELKRYAGWDDRSFRETINRFIINESQSKCSIRLGEDDLRALWE